MNVFLQKCPTGHVQRSRDIGRACAALESLEESKAWRVSVEEVKSERSLQQNKYLFGVAYKLLSEATGVEKHEMHEDFLKMVFGARLKRVKTLKGWREIEIPVRTTTTDEHGRRSVLGKIAFAEFVAFIQRYAAQEAGVFIPDPDPTLAADYDEQAAA
jgi:hypothetical protein